MILRLPEINFIDDKGDKPVSIHKCIGRRPIAAFGNSDGDFEMREWTHPVLAGGLASLFSTTIGSASML